MMKSFLALRSLFPHAISAALPLLPSCSLRFVSRLKQKLNQVLYFNTRVPSSAFVIACFCVWQTVPCSKAAAKTFYLDNQSANSLLEPYHDLHQRHPSRLRLNNPQQLHPQRRSYQQSKRQQSKRQFDH
ncbi:hypothetical protein BJ546DRAFT_116247 [Cryomyces antarcticus]